jgi:peptidyl-tRNA hydrolase
MLTHYIVVRKDLPVGVMAAMVTHAAGESASLYQDRYDGRFRGATAVVLEVEDQDGLEKAVGKLFNAGVPYVTVYERGGPYDGQFMAIGVVPTERDKVAPVFENYRLIGAQCCQCTNCRERVDKQPSGG